MWQCFRGNADPTVRDRKFRVSIDCLDRYVHLAAFTRVLDRVVYQVYYNLFQAGGVTFHLNWSAAVTSQSNLLILCEEFHLIRGATNELGKVESLSRH